MAGTALGNLRAAARKAGCTPEEYAARIASGEKWCFACSAWHPRDAFGADASRADSLAAACRASKNGLARHAYAPRPRPNPGRRFVSPRDGDIKQAERRINHLVAVGLLPRADALQCTDCDQPAREYDHHLGYAIAHHEHVQPVCRSCHSRRAWRRRRGAET